MRSSKRVAFWLAGLSFVCFVYFLPRWHDWNQDARMDMTMSIVNHGTIDIDAYRPNTEDRDHFDGHYLSNKAPGQSLLGVPVYLVFDALEDIPGGRQTVDAVERNSAWRSALSDGSCLTVVKGDPCRFELRPRLDFALLQYLESIFTAAIPGALLLLIFFWILGLFSQSVANRAALTLALGLGTMVFPYSQEFYSHVPAALFDFLGFGLVYILGSRGEIWGTSWLRKHGVTTAAIAGLSLGLSVVFEYPATLIVVLIGIYSLFKLPKAYLAPLVAGLVPPVAIVMSYNYAGYHDPFTTGYGCNDVRWPGECKGVAGFTLPPDGNALLQMTVGRYRGLFFMSPFLLLAVPGFFLWFLRRAFDRLTVALSALIPLIFTVAISSYWGWYGGQVAGPRYLMEMVPFLALPIIFVLDRLHTIWARMGVLAWGVVSLVNVWVETIGGRAYASGGEQDPLFRYGFPEVGHGVFALNLGNFLGLSGMPSLALLAGILAVWTFAILGQKWPQTKHVTATSSSDRLPSAV